MVLEISNATFVTKGNASPVSSFLTNVPFDVPSDLIKTLMVPPIKIVTLSL